MGFTTAIAIKFDRSLDELTDRLEEICDLFLINSDEDFNPIEQKKIIYHWNRVLGMHFYLSVTRFLGGEEINFQDFQYVLGIQVGFDILDMEAAVALSEVMARAISKELKTEVMVVLDCEALYARYKLGEPIFKDVATKERLFKDFSSR